MQVKSLEILNLAFIRQIIVLDEKERRGNFNESLVPSHVNGPRSYMILRFHGSRDCVGCWYLHYYSFGSGVGVG